MWLFSKEVNKYLKKELVNKENEEKFLNDFKNELDNQVFLSESMLNTGSRYHDVVKVWDVSLPVTFDVEIDSDGVLFAEDIEIKD